MLRDALRRLLADSLAATPPDLTRRDLRIPAVANKAFAVVGVRRCGKTTFLWQIVRDRIAEGRAREAMLFVGLEDDRLAGMTTADLSWLVEEYLRTYPQVRSRVGMTLLLDEVQVVPGWETLVRRLMDTERVEVFVSGSSARLLSREVATAMRGRALEVSVHPFSFREALRHRGEEPTESWDRLPKARRSEVEQRLRAYLWEGGFPEAQSTAPRDRMALLSSYVDVVALRDVIERHGVTNPVALRWMMRHLLASPASPFSVQKIHAAMRSQGVAVSKDSLHSWLAHLEDTFLLRTVPMHSRSERQRMVNPRKAYPVDPGLVALYDRTGTPNLGHVLETVVCVELERRGYSLEYVRTASGYEVDFLASAPGEPALLVQVCVDVSQPTTWQREVRALAEASASLPAARPKLLTLESEPPNATLPDGIEWQPVVAWLLEGR